MNLQTYLFFGDCCEEAIRFYEGAVGARCEFILRYKDGPPALIPLNGEELIFHATLAIGDTRINMSDDSERAAIGFGGFAFLLHLDADSDAELAHANLAVGGEVQMPMAQVPWASQYGIVLDRFGVLWKIQSG